MPSLVRFWASLLDGYEVRAYDDVEIARLAKEGLTPETDTTVMVDGSGLSLCFQKVPDRKYENNRIHIDVAVEDLHNEIERMCELGASIHRESDEYTVMKDSEGNQFCLVEKSGVSLRDATEDDLPVFFEFQLGAEANHMAAFTAKDPADKDAFMEHWRRILADEAITKKTILYDLRVVGNVLSFEQFGEREVSYWIAREYWGKGVATKALSEFLDLIKVRPLYARAAKDNIASIRVLEKCGFTVSGEDKGFSDARGEEVEEFILKLGAN